MDKEIRSYTGADAEVRATRRGRVISGRAIVFGKESRDLGGFVEVIERSAIDGVLEKSDVLALLNHNEDKGVLARSTNGTGTLTLTVDDLGVNYEFEAPDTALGDEVLSGIRRGDIRTSSFAFTITDKGDTWEKREDGTFKRTINQFDLIYDVSPVYREAYEDTTAAVRSLVNVKVKDAEKRAADEKKRADDLEAELRKKSSSNSTNSPNSDPAQNKRSMGAEKLRKETLKDGTVIGYEDWLSKGSQIFVLKDGNFVAAPDGKMTVREREEVYTSNMEMVIKDGYVTSITSSSTSISRKEPPKEYYQNLRKLIPRK